MKLRIFSILMVCILLTTSVMGQTIASLDNAKQAYEKGDFENAIQFFELTVDGGIYNGEIFYNLGNAYYQRNDIAHALLNYRRALQTLPRDLDLNIQIARTRSVRTVPQTETTHPLILLEQMTENIVTIQELSIVTFGMWILFWVLVAIYQLRGNWRSTLRLVMGICFVLVLGLGILLGARIYIYNNMPPAVVTVGSTPVYTGPSISYFHQSDLFAASEIYIVEEQDEWRRFVTSDNLQGWVQVNAITYVAIE